MDWRKLGRALLFPPAVLAVALLPVVAVCLVCALLFAEADAVAAILSYVLAFYTLLIWSLKLPELIRGFRQFQNKNRYARRWREDPLLRVKVSLYGALLWNTAYALLQLGMGFWHHSFWFFSLAGYYGCLALMRFYLARYTARHKPGEKLEEERLCYRICGIILLVMNLALSLMVFFMVYWDRTFRHHEITTIMLASYTFTAFTVAVVNLIKYRKYHSPVYSASKAVSLAAACVSMLTLESTMLTTFGDGTMEALERKLLLGCTGGAISMFVIVMAVFMIRQSGKNKK